MTLYTCYQSILSNHHNGMLIFEQTYHTMYKIKCMTERFVAPLPPA